MATARVPMGDLMKGVTINMVLTGVRRARLRLWLGSPLMLLGAHVIGCDVEMVVKPDGHQG